MSSQEIIIKEGVLKGAILPSLWLRERLSGDKFVDPNNLQRLYEPSLLDENLLIDSYAIKDDFLSIIFSDGVKGKISVDELYQEINSIDAIPKKKIWKKNDSLQIFDNNKIFENNLNLNITKTLEKLS